MPLWLMTYTDINIYPKVIRFFGSSRHATSKDIKPQALGQKSFSIFNSFRFFK